MHNVSMALKPPPKLTVSQWADAERRLSPESSAEVGKWHTDRAEYLRGIMDALNDPSIRQVVVMSSSQVGKTEFILNAIGYFVDQDPAPILVVMPTLGMGQSFSKDRLSTMLRDTPCLKNKVKEARTRDSNNTTLHKKFTGGHISIAGANSSAGLASRAIRILLCDEIDRFPHTAGLEGDPFRLAAKRTTTFWNSKIVTVSTPTVKGFSRIETEYENSDKREYLVKCKDCDTEQTLKWSNVRWEENKPSTASYVCDECGSIWNDADRFRAIKNGRWEATAKSKGIAGFKLSGLYSPWVTLEQAVVDFLESKKLPETLKVWVNTFLGESWEDEGENLRKIDLRSNTFEPSEEIDERILVITAGVDTQDDRLEYEIIGWGKDEESFSIGYGQIWGDLSTPEPWDDLDNILNQTFTTVSGRELKIRSTCIDSGGHYTQSVYNFVRPRQARRIFAIKGMAGEQRPLVSRPTRNNIGKIPLFTVGTFPIKELIFQRFRITIEGAGYCHFPADRDEEYFAQLTDSEKIVTKFQKGYPRREFVQTRKRNEALDLRVYGYAALCILNVNINALAERVENVKQKPKQKPTKVSTRKTQNFVNSWK